MDTPDSGIINMRYLLFLTMLLGQFSYILILKSELHLVQKDSNTAFSYLADCENSRARTVDKLDNCEDSKELIEYSERNAWLQRDHALAQSKKLLKRFQYTTDILEDSYLCTISGSAVRNSCNANLDILRLIEDNRKAKF